MNLRRPPSADEQFVIWLNDHRAIVSGEIALTQRCRSANVGTNLAHDLTGHLGAVSVDRDVLDELIEHSDGSIDQFKSVAAVAAERFGRVKLNGQLFGSSPLSRVIELEGLVAATETRAVLWRGVRRYGRVSDAVDAQVRDCSEAVDAQRDVLTRHLDQATADAFDPARAGDDG